MVATEALIVLEERPTAQVIADQLREQIIQGTFRPGQQIKESILAAQLRTSRAPVREAVQRLCQEGILISRRNRGVFVPELSIQEINEIYAVRQAVESLVVDVLLDGSQLRLQDTCGALKAVVDDMVKQVTASDWQEMAKLDMQFHAALVAGTGNRRLMRIYETLAAESRICMLSLEVSYTRPEVLVQEHQNILDLLQAGDRKGLRHAVKHHLQNAVEDLRAKSNDEEFTA
jgi:DNA-binding GntR family transcriptional regulator